MSNTVLKRPLGNSGLEVSIIGLGAGQLGGDLHEAEAAALLHGALDAGVNLIDTAPSYGCSEARIGRILRARRGEFILSTKGGYGAPGAMDWTAAAITYGIDAALLRLASEQIDIFLLHSCPLETLRRDDLLRALEDARLKGKIRVAGYSGENEALQFAIESGHFGCVMTSCNLCDQRGLRRLIPDAAQRGLGVLGKRPLANMAWQFRQCPEGQYAETYWRRLAQMGIRSRFTQEADSDSAIHGLALRFSAFAPGVSSVLVGTKSLAHLLHNLDLLAEGPLDPSTLLQLQSAFFAAGADWDGQI